MEIERHRGLIRFALLFMAVSIGWLAVWILVAPKGFYDTFPGGGSTGSRPCRPTTSTSSAISAPSRLGLTVLAALAALWMEQRLVQAAAITLLVAGLPHLGYHLTTTGHYSTGDNIASLTGLVLSSSPASSAWPRTCSCRWRPLPGQRRRAAACDPAGGG